MSTVARAETKVFKQNAYPLPDAITEVVSPKDLLDILMLNGIKGLLEINEQEQTFDLLPVYIFNHVSSTS